ncbi:MAG: GAF domain-containing protein [Gammaproteobacteria bacterium]|nr:MAG: GAF domain-containing protein [Gammaproteobacteria bacterium]
MMANPSSALNLENCAHEPIHIPGSVQPHGALIVLTETLQINGWSANCELLLRLEPKLNAPARSLRLDTEIFSAIDDILSSMENGEASPLALETQIKNELFDVVIHAHLHRIIVEFERRDTPSDEVASFALKAHRAIDRFKRQKSIDSLLQIAVEEIQKLTGFDRVMAYIFRHDDSGDIVAEERRADLDPYLGRRYPASDIPAQARRLYTLNTLRVIPDLTYEPVPLVGVEDGPLDMSFCILRSVSPVHVEYLRNVGIGASMSVSIIVNGHLWGMIACHHMSARQIPYSIRMACDVLAQIIASTVASIQEHDRAEATRNINAIRMALMETLLDEDDVSQALALHAEPLKNTLGAAALVIAQHGKILIFGDVSSTMAMDILELLPTDGDDLVLWQSRKEWPALLQERINKWVGLLALRFDRITAGWILAFRAEQIETINWGNKPERHIESGPLGPRLTPKGSFEEWKEVVRDSAEPWDNIQVEFARELLNALLRSCNRRHAEIDRARTQLMAILGHDLRDPLNNINLAASFLEQGSGANKMGTVIRNSSSRMQRLVEQVLDMSRIGTGIGLVLNAKEVDVTTIVRDLISETRLGYPGIDYDINMPETFIWNLDPDRLAQAIGNLLSNARHHTSAKSSIRLSMGTSEENLIIEVSNEANEIEPEVVESLFAPFKKSSSSRGRTGLGLGLYISHEIVNGHGGQLTYRYEAPHVIFKIALPRQQQ